MANKMKIKLKGYDHKLIDGSLKSIIEQVEQSGAKVVGPVPLPTDKSIYTILRSVHVNKTSREQFELRTHKRMIEVLNPNAETEAALSRLAIPAGVVVEVKM